MFTRGLLQAGQQSAVPGIALAALAARRARRFGGRRVSKLTGTRHPPVGRNGPGTGFANSGLKIANRELAQIRKLGKNPKRFRCLAGERAGDRTQDPLIKSLN